MAENAGIPADILDRAERDQTTRQDVDSLTPAQLDALEAWLRGIGKR